MTTLTNALPAVLLAAAVMLTTPASAEVAMSGSLTASRACPALQSIRKKTNPGDVALDVGTTYAVVAANKSPADHYLLVVPGADPERRWVETSCGSLSGAAAAAPRDTGAEERKSAGQGGGIDAILAISWQPSFCETKPDKTECRTQTADRFDATHFTLHGLWPQPRSNAYCGVPEKDVTADRTGKWKKLPAVRLSAATRAELDKVMPGTRSNLERHEWTKHGTCYGLSMEDYFSSALNLMRDVNASPVQALFARKLGGEVTSGEVAAAFDAAFGKGAGARIRMSCAEDPSTGRRMVGEITIALAGSAAGKRGLGDLMLAAAPTADRGCPRGVVDGAGAR